MGKVLITGGAGFIGSHLVNKMLAKGYDVRVLDAFIEQVHGNLPRELPAEAQVIRGDMRDRNLVEIALEGVEYVFHLAAEVGVGQSMYEIHRYIDGNARGVAVLLEALVERKEQIRKLIVASSMSVYGEGSYECSACDLASPLPRSLEQLSKLDWEVHCKNCNSNLKPLPTSENKRLEPSSVYAVNKQDHEQYCLIVGKAYGIPTVALRYFNIYGPGQALSNPYTGALAIFSSRLLNNQPPLIFEDGLQSRDFTNVADVVQANFLAMERDEANYQTINVGTGIATPIKNLVPSLSRCLGVDINSEIVNKFREGDIRHCVADITKARQLLGYEPKVSLKDGIIELIDWVKTQKATDAVEKATEELKAQGLVK